MTPSVGITTGDPIISWSVSPELPAGLTMNAEGTVSGTPAFVQSRVNYTFYAANSGGVALFMQALHHLAPFIIQEMVVIESLYSMWLLGNCGCASPPKWSWV